MYSNIQIIGNVGQPPEMRYTPNGKAVTNFSVAENRQYTNAAGEQVKETVWYRISTWGKLAEGCNQYVHKGDRVFVAGQLTADGTTGGPRLWKTQTGETRASFEVRADTVRFLTPKGQQEHAEPESIEPGDLPF